MKSVVVGTIVLMTLPFSAMAGSRTQANLEEALRQQQLICAGMADVAARGGSYSGHQLAQCLVTLETQRADYQRYMAASAFAGK